MPQSDRVRPRSAIPNRTIAAAVEEAASIAALPTRLALSQRIAVLIAFGDRSQAPDHAH